MPSNVDDIVPRKGGTPATTVCEAVYGGPGHLPGLPGWTWAYVPAGCPTNTFQPAYGSRPGPGLLPGPTLNGVHTYYCQSSQPRWHAFRTVAVGFGGLTFHSDTQARVVCMCV